MTANELIAGLIVCVTIVMGFIGFWLLMYTYKLPDHNWECTQSEIVKVTPPREEKCVQYSRIKEPKQ